MTREQRFRYEMFVRVSKFGAANRERFPESSKGGRMFALVAAAVEAVEEFFTSRVKASSDAGKVKATTRDGVTRYMRAIAATGRRVAKSESSVNPFRMPARRSAASLLASARLFQREARMREAVFVEFGLSPGFISEFGTLVDELEQAVDVQLVSRSALRKARAGLETTLADGLEVIRDLDVTVANVLHDDPVGLAEWRGARQIEALVRGLTRPLTPEPGVPQDGRPGAATPVNSPAPADSPEPEQKAS